MATPSITMIPSGYKSQKVYSVLPTNGDGDLTFDRNNAGSRVNKNGLIEQVATDIPRLDYSDGSCPSLLLEPASLNLALYSEDFSQWTKLEINGTSTIISSSQLSPSGTNNAYRVNCVLDDNTFNNQATLRLSSVSGLTSSNRTVSFYLRSDTSSEVMVRSPYNDGTYTTFQLTNNWERYSVPLNDVVVTTCLIEIGLRAITGFGDTNLNATFDVWGAQLEEKPYATSYIPTTSETASRGADSAIKDGLSSYISSTAGVLYAEFAALSNELDGFYNVLTLNVGTATGANGVLLGFNTTNQIYSSVGGQFISSYTPTDATDFHKVAVKYEDNNSKLFVNGVQVGSTETTATIPSGLSRLGFDSGGGGSKFHVKVKDVRVYNTALTDLELQTLTTI